MVELTELFLWLQNTFNKIIYTNIVLFEIHQIFLFVFHKWKLGFKLFYITFLVNVVLIIRNPKVKILKYEKLSKHINHEIT